MKEEGWLDELFCFAGWVYYCLKVYYKVGIGHMVIRKEIAIPILGQTVQFKVRKEVWVTKYNAYTKLRFDITSHATGYMFSSCMHAQQNRISSQSLVCTICMFYCRNLCRNHVNTSNISI